MGLRTLERRDDHRVDLVGQLRERPHVEPEELAATALVEDADQLDLELAQREVRELGRLPRAAERQALGPAAGSRPSDSRSVCRVRRYTWSEWLMCSYVSRLFSAMPFGVSRYRSRFRAAGFRGNATILMKPL
jgi:hypothetical protein